MFTMFIISLVITAFVMIAVRLWFGDMGMGGFSVLIGLTVMVVSYMLTGWLLPLGIRAWHAVF